MYSILYITYIHIHTNVLCISLLTESSSNPEPVKTAKSPSPTTQTPPQESTPDTATSEQKDDVGNQSEASEPPKETEDK